MAEKGKRCKRSISFQRFSYSPTKQDTISSMPFSDHALTRRPTFRSQGKPFRNSLSTPYSLSIFSSPQKEKSNQSLKSSQSSSKLTSSKNAQKKQMRVESLSNIMQRCTKVKEAFYFQDIFMRHWRFNQDLCKLEKAIEKCKDPDSLSPLKSEVILRSDSRALRQQLSFSEKHRKQTKGIWKYTSPAISKKTNKLVASVAKKLKVKLINDIIIK